MQNEIYSDGISEISITGSIVRIDLMSLSPADRDVNNNPKPMFRQRIIMPVEAFANSVELMQRVVKGLIDAGAIKQNDASPSEMEANRTRNFSPNFS